MKTNTLKASELIVKLQELINKHGDAYIYKTHKGEVHPIHLIDYYTQDKYIEII